MEMNRASAEAVPTRESGAKAPLGTLLGPGMLLFDPNDGRPQVWAVKAVGARQATLLAHYGSCHSEMPPDPSWTWAKSMKEAQELFRAHVVTEASLDHDLGYRPGADGIDLVRWMCEREYFPADGITIHSWNAVGAQAMADALRGAGCPSRVLIRPFEIARKR